MIKLVFLPRLWVRTHFFDFALIVCVRARGAQRLPPRSGAFQKILRPQIKSLRVIFQGKTTRVACITGAYEAYSSRSVHSHLSVERVEWSSRLVPQRTALDTPLGRRGRWPRRPVTPPSDACLCICDACLCICDAWIFFARLSLLLLLRLYS